jgi:hypothetical protein
VKNRFQNLLFKFNLQRYIEWGHLGNSEASVHIRGSQRLLGMRPELNPARRGPNDPPAPDLAASPRRPINGRAGGGGSRGGRVGTFHDILQSKTPLQLMTASAVHVTSLTSGRDDPDARLGRDPERRFCRARGSSAAITPGVEISRFRQGRFCSNVRSHRVGAHVERRTGSTWGCTTCIWCTHSACKAPGFNP